MPRFPVFSKIIGRVIGKLAVDLIGLKHRRCLSIDSQSSFSPLEISISSVLTKVHKCFVSTTITLRR